MLRVLYKLWEASISVTTLVSRSANCPLCQGGTGDPHFVPPAPSLRKTVAFLQDYLQSPLAKSSSSLHYLCPAPWIPTATGTYLSSLKSSGKLGGESSMTHSYLQSKQWVSKSTSAVKWRGGPKKKKERKKGNKRFWYLTELKEQY